MKNLNIYIAFFTILISSTISGQEQESSLEIAIRKAKSDLVEVLSKTGKEYNFGINADAVNASTVANAISYHEMNFDKLLSNNQQNINGMLNPEMKKIVPLINGNKVVTTVSVSNKTKESQGKYRVTELINHRFYKEINALPQEIKLQKFRNLKIIYVPNLNTTVYNYNGKNYTSYKGRSLTEPINDASILSLLKSDAAVFIAKYGEQLKKGRLLN